MRKSRGFTLIEMMVVCGIMLAAMGLGITRYNDYAQKRRLNGQAKQLTDAMKLASVRALSGDAGAACADFQGYQVALTTTGTYTVKKCCEGACTSAQSTSVATYTLPNGIALTAPAANTTYLFNKLDQTVSIAPSANQTITLRNTLISRCISITIPPSGVVDIQNEVAC
jgi:prepilin-type N-terminal cleavage/methylation domain-containing protein